MGKIIALIVFSPLPSHRIGSLLGGSTLAENRAEDAPSITFRGHSAVWKPIKRQKRCRGPGRDARGLGSCAWGRPARPRPEPAAPGPQFPLLSRLGRGREPGVVDKGLWAASPLLPLWPVSFQCPSLWAASWPGATGSSAPGAQRWAPGLTPTSARSPAKPGARRLLLWSKL